MNFSSYYRRCFLLGNRRLSTSSCTKLTRSIFRRHGYKLALVNPLRSDGFMFETSKLVKSSMPQCLSPVVDELARSRRESKDNSNPKTTIKNKLLESKHSTIQKDEVEDIMSCISDYCAGIGYEFDHCELESERDFFCEIAEGKNSGSAFQDVDDLWIYEQLRRAEEFEELLAVRYSAARRFSLEGMDSAVPCLNSIISAFAKWPRDRSRSPPRILLGTTHRGRLNLAANVLKVPIDELLLQWDKTSGPSFDDITTPTSNTVELMIEKDSRVRISMLPIPAHLEVAAPVLLGKSRAYATELASNLSARANGNSHIWKDSTDAVLNICVHGDASFCGEGVTQEALQLATFDHYEAGGTIHLILNNQIGYTAEMSKLRAVNAKLTQATDIARSIGAPILHVNGCNPRSVVQAAQIAVNFRQQFGKDIVIDLWGWREHGHNELDDPTVTNVSMYHKLEKRKHVAAMFRQSLEGDGETHLATALDEVSDRVKSEFKAVREPESTEEKGVQRPELLRQLHHNRWSDLASRPRETAVSSEVIVEASAPLINIPSGFLLHPRVQKVVESRSTELSALDDGRIDWPTAELLALSTLSTEGLQIRFSGQDVERGTFSQRHAVWYDQHTGRKHIALPSSVEICNSPLSELGVVGYEFGWSTVNPLSLVLWEAQFGDFFNNAQVVIDTLLSSCEEKWQIQSGLVLLLPHGYDGLGPEHSSSRLERWLQMFSCRKAKESEQHNNPNLVYESCNMIVAYPTEPSNYFHLLRRQLTWPFRRPLIVLSPKRTLRSAAATSPLSNFIAGGTQETFQCALDDPYIVDNNRSQITGVILCSGEIYFDLCKLREKDDHHSWNNNTAIIRLEQLAPFPAQELEDILKNYHNLSAAIWVQEEPENDGALRFVQRHVVQNPSIPSLAKANFTWVSRPEAAAPALGDPFRHSNDQQNLFDRVLQWSHIVADTANNSGEDSTRRSSVH